MEIRVGYELIYDCPRPTPMMLVLHIHYSRASDIIVPDHVTTTPSLPLSAYRDGFGNWCARTGYLGDIGTPPPYGPMDFAAWFEAYLGGRWEAGFTNYFTRLP